MAITVNLIKQIEIPSLPNFLRFKKDKEGRGVQGTIDLGELDEEGFLEFQEQYGVALHVHWQKRRNNLKQE